MTAGSDDKHETARKVTEEALDAYVHGDREAGDELVDEAKRTDSSAVQEVLKDLDEDAGSDHTVPEENR
jgi:hypothetical protein